jgi:hypothetical protein
MTRKRYPPDKIIQKLREAEVLLGQGHTVKHIVRALCAVHGRSPGE